MENSLYLAEIVFWISLSLVLYTYLIYPLFMSVWSRRYPERIARIPESYPSVSIVFAAYNEEAVIADKIRNCLSLDYPADKIEICAGSDGSSDRTNEIMESMANPALKFFCFSGRNGKSWILNKIVPECSGDILVFTDANVMFEKGALKNLVSRFHESRTGGVCGRLVMKTEDNDTEKSAEQSYWSLENRLKSYEARIRTALGATGGIYAVRRELFRPLPMERSVVDDFLIPVFVNLQGYDIDFADDAIANEVIVPSLFVEFRRRIRIGTGNFCGIRYYRKLLNPARGFIAFGLWSHKILRWFVPVFLCSAALSLILLMNYGFYVWLFYGAVLFVALALAGILLNLLKIEFKFLSFFAYGLMLNLGLFVGFFRYLFKLDKPVWDSTPRPVNQG